MQTSITAIQTDPERFVGRCVTVSGAVSGRRMYTGREGIYLVSRSWEAHDGSSTDYRHRLGIDAQQGPGWSGPPVWATVTGWLDSCELRAERIRRSQAPGALPVMLGGYCHWEGGPVLVPSSYSHGELRYERLVGEENRRRFGNLARMPAGWPFRTQFERIAEEFLAALRSRDRAALVALHDDQIDEDDLHYLLDDPDSPFTNIRQSAPAQTAIFVGIGPDGSLLDRDEPKSVICFCRTPDCSGRWPIAKFDAGTAPERPYVCTQVLPRDWVGRGYGLDQPMRGTWLDEPMETAFRR